MTNPKFAVGNTLCISRKEIIKERNARYRRDNSDTIKQCKAQYRQAHLVEIIGGYTMTNPKFAVGDTLYLRESAALGFLEAVYITEVRNRGNNWLYAYRQTSRYVPMGKQAIGNYGDRRSFASGAQLLLDETEMVSYPDALDMAVANAQQQLNYLQLLRSAFPPNGST